MNDYIAVTYCLRNDYINELNPINIGGISYPSVEHAFQAAKTKDLDLKQKIASSSLKEARKIGKSVKLPDDWEDKRLPIMEFLVREKFFNDHDSRLILMNTGKKEIKMLSKDIFWNEHLPQILTKIRDEIQFIEGWEEKESIEEKLAKELYTCTPNALLKVIINLYTVCNRIVEHDFEHDTSIGLSEFLFDDLKSNITKIKEFFEDDSISEENGDDEYDGGDEDTY